MERPVNEVDLCSRKSAKACNKQTIRSSVSRLLLMFGCVVYDHVRCTCSRISATACSRQMVRSGMSKLLLGLGALCMIT